MKDRPKRPEPGLSDADRASRASDLLRSRRPRGAAVEGRSPSPALGTTRVIARDDLERDAPGEEDRDDTASFELPAGADDEGLHDAPTPPRAPSAPPAAEPPPRGRGGQETRRLAIADLAPRPASVADRAEPARITGDVEPAEPEPDSLTDSQETVTFAYPQEVVAASARPPEPAEGPPVRSKRETARLPLCDVEPTQPDVLEADVTRSAAAAGPRGDAAPARDRPASPGSSALEPTRHRSAAPGHAPTDHATTVVREAPTPDEDPPEADGDPDEAALDPAPEVVSFLDPAPEVVSFLDPPPGAEPPEPEPAMESLLEAGSGAAAYLDPGFDEGALIEQGLDAEPAPEPESPEEAPLDQAPVVVSFIEPRLPDPESTTRLDGLPPYALRDRARADAERTDRFVKPRLPAEGEDEADRAATQIVPAAVVVKQERGQEREAPTDPVVRAKPSSGDSLSFLLPWRTRRAPPWTYPAAERHDASRPAVPRPSRRLGRGGLAFGALMAALGLVAGALAAAAAIGSGVDLGPLSARGAERAETRARPPAPLVVRDRLFWTGDGGNLSLVVSATFTDRDDFARALDLSRPVGDFDGRPWTLSEVLVDLDLNADGYGATWRVSGPRELIAAHADELRRLERSGELHDLSIADLEVATADR